MDLRLGKKIVGLDHPTYFVADISANHDGLLDRAIELIHLCAQAGTDAVKFQNFRAAEIVSNQGFRILGDQRSHQAKWETSVFEVYQAASLPWEWTSTLKAECEKAKVEYFSAPYDLEAIDMLDAYMEMYKIGSGDITWLEAIRRIAQKGKPVFLATGAATMDDVQRAVSEILAINSQLVLMQCNTNYTGSIENFRHIHLNVLKNYALCFPEVVLGLSDHTPGHATVLGSVALGARVIEKHFTDDRTRIGPDHPFSMTPTDWREMVHRTRELELALGRAEKRICDNEKDTVVIQRRCLRAKVPLDVGTVITREMLTVLRPAPAGGIFAHELENVIGKRVAVQVEAGVHLQWAHLAVSNS
jgi:N-acetylneuraminate synthase